MAETDPIADSQQLENWLADKPRSWTHDLEVRAALRVLPLVLEIFGPSEDQIALRQKKEITLGAFRAALVAWTAQSPVADAAIPTNVISAAAVSAANAITAPLDPSGAAFSVVSAAVTSVTNAAISISKSSATDTHVANTAAKAAGISSIYDGETDIWDSIRADVNWLVNSKDGYLIDQPLWLNDVRRDNRFQVNFPLWARRPLDAFDKSSLVTKGPWGVWLDWYRAILSNDRTKRSALITRDESLRLATKDSKFWERDPDEVMVDIAEIGRWNWSSKIPSPELQPPLASDHQGELVRAHSDEPTDIDELNRRPFARALVERMDDISSQRGLDGFAVHIHAPWGAGKTSVLLMMREMLRAEDRKTAGGQAARQWIVVDFNGWKNERRNPPWWPLIQDVYAECLRCLRRSDAERAMWLGRYWQWWKFRADALPYFVFVLITAISIVVLWYTSGAGRSQNPYEWALKIFTAAIATIVSFVTASRIAVFGSVTNAKFYEDLSQDPLKRITRLFRKIVDTTGKPVCVIIDDL